VQADVTEFRTRDVATSGILTPPSLSLNCVASRTYNAGRCSFASFCAENPEVQKFAIRHFFVLR